MRACSPSSTLLTTTVAPNATAEKNAARQRRLARKYTPVIAGVSLMPATMPTIPPDSHHRLLRTATITASTRKTLICP